MLKPDDKMNVFLQLAIRKILSGILILSLSALTIGTSVMSVGKIKNNFVAGENNPIRTSQLSKDVRGIAIQDQETGSADGSGGSNGSNTVQNNGSLLALTTANSQSTASQATTSSGSCIITLFGKQYFLIVLKI